MGRGWSTVVCVEHAACLAPRGIYAVAYKYRLGNLTNVRAVSLCMLSASNEI